MHAQLLVSSGHAINWQHVSISSQEKCAMRAWKSLKLVDVGSMTMWALPPGYSLPLHNADSIFATMNLEDYLPVPADEADMVQLFVHNVLKKLNHIRKLLLDAGFRLTFGKRRWLWTPVTIGNKLVQHCGLHRPCFVPCNCHKVFCSRRLYRALRVFHGVGKGRLWCWLIRLVQRGPSRQGIYADRAGDR